MDVAKEKGPPRASGEASGNGQALELNHEYTTIPDRVFKSAFAKVIEEINGRYAVVNDGGKCLVVRKVWDHQLKRAMLERISFSDFKRMFSNRPLAKKILGEWKRKGAGEWWLEDPNRRQYLGGVLCDPTQSVPSDHWNLWQGFTVTPQPGDWTLMRNHLSEVICGGDATSHEYLLSWFARMFQHPELQGEVAIVLKGEKGAGKGTVGHWMQKAFGQHALHISNAKHLVGNFNGHLRDAIFVFADESFALTDRQQEAVLKALITERTIFLEAKYQNPVSVANMTHILMASNDDWVVPASTDERRYLVLEVLPIHVGDTGYFEAISDQMKNGGLAGMIFDLLGRDLSTFNHRKVPWTQALDSQKKHSLKSLEKWWFAVLDRGYVWKSRFGHRYFSEWHCFVSTDLLFESYTRWAAETRERKIASREQLGIFLTSMYEPARPGGRHIIGEVVAIVDGGEILVDQNRPPGYQLGDLDSARDAFSTKVRLSFRWDDSCDRTSKGGRVRSE